MSPTARYSRVLPGTRLRPTRRASRTATSGSRVDRLRLEPVPSLEDPPHRCEAQGQEADRHGQAHTNAHVGDPVEAPPEAADQVDDGVEQAGRLPERWQHIDRVEAAAEEDQGRHDEEWYELEFLEAVGPDAQDEAEEAEGHGREHEEGKHPQRVRDLKRHEQA